MPQEILIIDIDSKIPNLALKKIEKYHLDKGDNVTWDFPLMRNIADKIYVSCIFTENKWKCKEWEGEAEIGGSGYSLSVMLPYEIEQVNPKINIGFTTRGCIRKCPFCIVPEKEGNIMAVGNIYDIWDGKSKELTLLDNNILAQPEHFKLICSQLRKENIKVDFNQGLDCRLLNQDVIDELKTIRHEELRFAFDFVHLENSVLNAIKLLQKNDINRCCWYVLVGYNTTFEEDLYRLELLKEHNQRPYLQRYIDCYKDKKYIALARWVNQAHLFQGMTFQQFLDREENKQYGQYFSKI